VPPHPPPPDETSSQEPSTGSAARNAVDAYVRRKLLSALVSILVLVAAVALLSIFYREELDDVTAWIFDQIGLTGLVVLLFISDAVFSPVPPDAVLVLISKSPYHASWPTLIPVLGLLSTVGGWIGYFIGRKIAHTSLPRYLFQHFKQRSAAIIHRYGPWGVVLGALTPMPFSITCWTAGMLEIPFRRVAWPCLLRVPRFVIYYLVIAYAEALVRLVF
jgi:membrane protein YqaA with SNARE-associated domain